MLIGNSSIPHFIYSTIIELPLLEDMQQKWRAGKFDQGKTLVPITPDNNISQMIRQWYTKKVLNRVHPRVCEFLYKAAQMMLIDVVAIFNEDKGNQEAKESVISLLMYVDAVANGKIEDSLLQVQALRDQSIKCLTDLVMDQDNLQIQKFAIEALKLTNRKLLT